MKPITQRQQQILDFLASSIRARGYSPTCQEVGDAMGITRQAVDLQFRTLRTRGLLAPTRMRNRGALPIAMGFDPDKHPSRLETRVLRAIEEYIKECGVAPSYQDVADMVGYKAGKGISPTIAALRRKGLLITPTKCTRWGLVPAGRCAVCGRDGPTGAAEPVDRYAGVD